MPKKRTGAVAARADPAVTDYRFDAKRTNIPPAGLAAQGKLQQAPRIRYEYDPHRPPVLRFDAAGEADRLARAASRSPAGGR